MITLQELKQKTEVGLLNTIEKEMNEAAAKGQFYVVVPGMTTAVRTKLQNEGWFVESLGDRTHRISWQCE